MNLATSLNGCFTVPDGLFRYKLADDQPEYSLDLCEFDLKYREWYALNYPDGGNVPKFHIHWMAQQFREWLEANQGPKLTLGQADALLYACNCESVEAKKKQNEHWSLTLNLRNSTQLTPEG